MARGGEARNAPAKNNNYRGKREFRYDGHDREPGRAAQKKAMRNRRSRRRGRVNLRNLRESFND